MGGRGTDLARHGAMRQQRLVLSWHNLPSWLQHAKLDPGHTWSQLTAAATAQCTQHGTSSGSGRGAPAAGLDQAHPGRSSTQGSRRPVTQQGHPGRDENGWRRQPSGSGGQAGRIPAALHGLIQGPGRDKHKCPVKHGCTISAPKSGGRVAAGEQGLRESSPCGSSSTHLRHHRYRARSQDPLVA